MTTLSVAKDVEKMSLLHVDAVHTGWAVLQVVWQILINMPLPHNAAIYHTGVKILHIHAHGYFIPPSPESLICPSYDRQAAKYMMTHKYHDILTW